MSGAPTPSSAVPAAPRRRRAETNAGEGAGALLYGENEWI